MHPILRDARRLGLYILGWIPLAAGMVFLTAPSPLSWGDSALVIIPICFLYAFVCLCSLYLCRAFPLSGQRIVPNLGQHILHALVGGAIWVVAAKVIAETAAIPAVSINAALPLLFSFGIVLYLVSIAMHSAFLALEASQLAQQREAQARLLASQAELRALRSQINPHFLYNSLNSISALTSIDSSKARQMCVQLSEFLRATLGLSEKERIPLEFELSLIRQYLAIEKTRFGKRLQFEEEVPVECLQDKIPALILQPLVENAVIHGIAGIDGEGVLRLIAGHGSTSQLSIVIENSFDPEFPRSARHGFGLNSIRKRLESEYGPAASLAISTGENFFRAELLLPVA
ncbi:MAG TPA: histidine kinase [Bryobacteraceae bacterium]|nr:histidine kinase [Bryobacteraceae bacterium]